MVPIRAGIRAKFRPVSGKVGRIPQLQCCVVWLAAEGAFGASGDGAQRKHDKLLACMSGWQRLHAAAQRNEVFVYSAVVHAVLFDFRPDAVKMLGKCLSNWFAVHNQLN
jgi:hypothetical protein